jgi:hypothetical protein
LHMLNKTGLQPSIRAGRILRGPQITERRFRQQIQTT